MKHLKSIILGLLTLWMLPLQEIMAQDKPHGQITGALYTENAEAVEFANVLLLSFPDSAYVKGTMSDEAGSFAFDKISEGDYQLVISSVGFRTFHSPEFKVTAQNTTDLGKLNILKDITELKAVTVSSQKPLVERKPDRLIFNVAGNVVSSGNTALELLTKAPGVFVDADGNVMLNGKSNVQVMINGKKSHLSGKQLKAMLNGLKSEQLATIEVITNPSAKYEAEGVGGILNLNLKQIDKGLTGAVYGSYGQGDFARFNGGGNLNYSAGKFGVFANVDYSDSRYYRNVIQTRDLGVEDQMARFEQEARHNLRDRFPYLRMGMDYRLDENNVFGLMINSFAYLQGEDLSLNSAFSDQTGRPTVNIMGNNTADKNFQKHSMNLNYSRKMDSLGRSLSVDIDATRFDNESFNYFNSSFYDPVNQEQNGQIISRGDMPYTVDILSAKIDYTHPFSASANLEAGLKASQVSSDNVVDYDSLIAQDWINDELRSNQFQYQERIGAAYVSFTKQYKKVTLKAGLRAEYTMMEGYSVTLDQRTENDYLKFFPSVFLTHKASADHVFSYSYSRRISRPKYMYLNPFVSFWDPYTAIEGNPYLNPEFTHALEASYIFKGKYSLSVAYTYTDQVISQVLKMSGDSPTTLISFDNLNSFNGVTASLSLPVSITKWWESSTSVEGMFRDFRSQQLLVNGQNKGFAVYLNTTHTFLLPAGIRAQLSGYYFSPYVKGVESVGAMFVASAGVHKNFMKDKLNVSLKLSDLFHSQRYISSYSNGTQEFDLRDSKDSRILKLSLNYQFSRGNKVKVRGRRRSGNAEEQGRVQ